MCRGVLFGVLAGLLVQGLPASTIGVYFNQADWEAAMSLNGTNPLTTISFADAQWTSSLQTLSRSAILTSQSSTAAGSGVGVTIASECGAPGVCGPLGQVTNGMWIDQLYKYSSTDFNFGSSIYGFGGDFDIAGSNGLWIAGVGDVATPNVTGGNPFLSYPGYDGFIGIISAAPMSDVLLSWGQNGSCSGCFGNSYTLTNLEVATIPTPEPNFKYMFAELTMMAVCYAVFKRS